MLFFRIRTCLLVDIRHPAPRGDYPKRRSVTHNGGFCSSCEPWPFTIRPDLFDYAVEHLPLFRFKFSFQIRRHVLSMMVRACNLRDSVRSSYGWLAPFPKRLFIILMSLFGGAQPPPPDAASQDPAAAMMSTRMLKFFLNPGARVWSGFLILVSSAPSRTSSDIDSFALQTFSH